MSFTLGVQPWFQRASVGADLARHSRDFGITFVEDECSGNNKSVPGLIPIGDRRKRRRSSDVTCDNAGGRVSGSVVMINGDNQDDAKLLRLFGGGDSDSGVSVNSVVAADHKELPIELDVMNVCSESVHEHADNSGGQSRCSVVLDPLPNDLLQSLTTEGRISAEKAAKTCQQTHEWEDSLPMISDNEVQGLLQNLVEEGEDSEPTLARCQRQESLLQPPSLRDDAIDYDVRDEGSRDSTLAPPGVKVRQRKSETPRKAIRRRRERHSSSDSRKKRRKRSTSCSTTSSTCSTSSHPHQHRHHHKHRHRHRTPSPPPRARVNPIFVWVKQDDTRIVEVLCEDYDKRNRIRLTKTPHGWRAIPRTERLSSLPASSTETVLDTSACGTEAGREAELETEEFAEALTEGSIIDHNITSLVQEDDELQDDDDTLSQQTKDEFEDETVLELEPSGIDTIIDNMLSPTTEDCNIDEQQYHDEENCEETGSENEQELELNSTDANESTDKSESEDTDDTSNHASVPVDTECVTSANERCVERPVLNLATDINEKVVSVAKEISPTVERDCKQVVQKDNIALDESVTKLQAVDTTIPDLAAMEELVPTDLSLPKTNDDNRQPPKVVFARSISSILRAPRTITPNSPSPLPSPISRSSPRLGISPALPEPAATSEVSPAHQTKQQKSMFLESLLSSPRKCHQVIKPTIEKDPSPLDLGKTSVRCSGSPTVSCSEEVKKTVIKNDTEEPKPKCLKLEDITLKSLLSRQTEGKNIVKEENVDVKVSKVQDTRKTFESTKSRKSRLLELLTSEPTNATVAPELDPLTQLKKILSDPEMAIPDPLLVPRDRLHELVSCPAKEIPRLLTLRPELRLPEALAYPSLLQDPNLLVVSIAYLQNLLRNPDKPIKESESYSSLGAFLEWQRYQSQQMHAVELLETQLKQQAALASGRDLDPGSAQALNQMMWLPYLNQLEATAMACGNNQEFLNVLNAVFPTGYGNGCGGVPYAPGMAVSPNFPMSADYKTQLELQQTFSMWQEVMAQAAASTQPVNNNLKNSVNTKTPPCTGNKMLPNRPLNVTKKNYSSARTSPITPNFHPQSRGVPNGHHHYPSLAPGGHASLHQYNQHQSRPRHQPTQQTPGPTKQPKPEVPSPTDQASKPIAPRPTVTCKSLRNLLSSPRREESPSQLLASFSKSVAHGDAATVHEATPKLKVKQHLVDPTIKPKLLKHEIKPEVATLAEERVSPPQLHPHLWHPLFGSQKTSYNSPWQWTTVTVNGE